MLFRIGGLLEMHAALQKVCNELIYVADRRCNKDNANTLNPSECPLVSLNTSIEDYTKKAVFLS